MTETPEHRCTEPPTCIFCQQSDPPPNEATRDERITDLKRDLFGAWDGS